MRFNLFSILLAFAVNLTWAQPYNITKFGAKGGENDDTKAIQKAIDKAAEKGGGTVYFPTGIFTSGTVFLKSNVTIYLEKGATWQGLTRLDAYPFIEPRVVTRMDLVARRAMVYANQQHNIAI
ncbi:MAG: glycoside hydrolase, partial [Bacteroidales bacterium]|nr:glycoside hydrolase [Bacteroidales bacterium]